MCFVNNTAYRTCEAADIKNNLLCHMMLASQVMLFCIHLYFPYKVICRFPAIWSWSWISDIEVIWFSLVCFFSAWLWSWQMGCIILLLPSYIHCFICKSLIYIICFDLLMARWHKFSIWLHCFKKCSSEMHHSVYQVFRKIFYNDHYIY
jgi:hypothetical protein